MIKVQNLTKKYNDLTAVSDLSFTIKEKQVVGLLGPNGAGKSTTMKMLTGYLSPTSGSVTVFGHDAFTEPVEARKHIGYLPEIPPIYPDFTVREHLRFVCDLRGVPAKQQKAEIDKVCAYLSITHVADRMIRNLSKGYRQRVGFAAALVGSPDFLILDEPTVGLDPEQIMEIRSLIAELSQNMSILISSHILSEISSVCGSLLIMRRGQLVASGTQAEIEHRLGDKPRIELLAKGDAAKIGDILHKVFPGGDIEMTPEGDKLFRIIAASGKSDPREALFRAFAQNSDKVSILSMRLITKTLEELFLEIVQS